MSETNTSGLADATVLIIRHAEKPEEEKHHHTGKHHPKGTDQPPEDIGLSSAGRARAEAYVSYFQNLVLEGVKTRPDTLVASADSKHSARPRLTLTPLSEALHLDINLMFSDADTGGLVNWLTTKQHGKTILIAWHHGQIPNLVSLLGADRYKLLPTGWPELVFDRVVVLRYDHAGKLATSYIIQEDIKI